jgi:hypothetical protein
MNPLVIIGVIFFAGFVCGYGLRAYLSYRRRH